MNSYIDELELSLSENLKKSDLDLAAILTEYENLLMGVQYWSEEKLDSVDVAYLESTDWCALGKWLYGKGKKYESTREYKELFAEHEKIHRFLGKAVRMRRESESLHAISAYFTVELPKEFSAIKIKLLNLILLDNVA